MCVVCICACVYALCKYECENVCECARCGTPLPEVEVRELNTCCVRCQNMNQWVVSNEAVLVGFSVCLNVPTLFLAGLTMCLNFKRRLISEVQNLQYLTNTMHPGSNVCL